jgi:glycosyltransferase involved in cell wall biosynthesis
MISLAIPTYNRPLLTLESFSLVINNDYINEIVIVDDGSIQKHFDCLKNEVEKLNNPKIKLFQNDSNFGPLLNKNITVNKCQNEWVVLLDSDNIIDDTYIEIIRKIEKNSDTLYCPAFLYQDITKNSISLNYKEFVGLDINKNTLKKYLEMKLFDALLNTGNYLVNKNSYLSILKDKEIDNILSVNDALYFSYLWLMEGFKIEVVPDLAYIHRVHNNSWYITHTNECQLSTTEIFKKIKNL